MSEQQRPFMNFNFEVTITEDGRPLTTVGFQEVQGLEVKMRTKEIREGGNNTQVFHGIGPAEYGQLLCRRGAAGNHELWDWMERLHGGRGRRADVTVELYGTDQAAVQLRFLATGCLPARLKGPDLNARDGQVAIEELLLVYETLSIERP